MPSYSYKCERCGNEFEEYIHTRAQADCNKAIPNSKRALCHMCLYISNRIMTGTRLYKYGANAAAMLADLKPTSDPMLDGKLSINAGRSYGVCVNFDPPKKRDENEANYLLSDAYECHCDFCKRKPGEAGNGSDK
jgi:hypothetical protein